MIVEMKVRENLRENETLELLEGLKVEFITNLEDATGILAQTES